MTRTTAPQMTGRTARIRRHSSVSKPSFESSFVSTPCARHPDSVAELFESVSNEKDIARLFERVTLCVTRTISCETCAIFELREDERTPVLRAVSGKRGNHVGKLVCEAWRDLNTASTSYADGARRLNAVPIENSFTPLARPRDAEVHRGALFQISSSGRLAGFLEVYSSLWPRYSRKDTVFLGCLADLLGVLIEKNRMKETLRRNEDRYRLMTEGSEKVFFYEHDLGRILTYVSPSVTEILGYTPGELIGHQCDEFLAGDATDELAIEYTNGALQDGIRRPPYLSVLRHKAGRKVIVEAVEAPFASAGQIVGMQGFARDVTERRIAEKNLQHRTAYLNALIVHNPLGIVVLDTENRVEMCNPAFEKIFQYKQADMIGSDLDGLIGSTESRAELVGLTRRTQCGEAVHSECIRYRKDGTSVDVELHGLPLIVHEERVGSFAIYQDTTERNRAEKFLRKMSGRLLHVQDRERRKIARELHDTTVQDLVALSMKLGAISDSCSSVLSVADRAALEHSVSLAEKCARELRTLSYLLHPPLLDEAGIGSAAIWYAEGFSKRSGIRVKVEIPRRIKRLPREMELTLFRIIQESLANIHKHSGGDEARIRLFKKANRVHLEVADNGHGIPPKALKSLSIDGSLIGVGIAGMRERVKQFGGRLDISSDIGTCVKVGIPITKQ